MTEKQLKWLKTCLKVLVSGLLIYFIFTKISFEAVLEVLATANAFYLAIAVFLFIVSKVLNAFRLNLYLHTIGAPLKQLSNLQLYLLGMFYNLFLPGGIGGDAYKGYVIQKKFQVGTKRVVSVLLLDRLSGMLLIFVFASVLALFVEHLFIQQFQWLLYLGIPLSVFTFWWINKRFFPFAIQVFWESLLYSAILQTAQLLAVVCILRALRIEADQVAYLFVFLISSIVSVIPLTIGGIGSREVTFLYGSKWLELNSDTSIAVSFVFFLITALVSLFGIYYHLKKPELSKVGSQ